MPYVRLDAKIRAIHRLIAGEEAEDLATELDASAAEIEEWRHEFEAFGKERIRDRFPRPSNLSRPRPNPSISTVAEALQYAGPRPEKSNTTYGRYFSDALAQVVANALRTRGFHGVLPDESGQGLESQSRTSHGFKKLDVNYSTPEMGLGLGISIKSINFRDPTSARYTKNYSRNDNELRAEAMDYHQRQPYSVLAACLFLPIDSCDDGSSGSEDEAGISSFGAAVRYFARRSPRGSVRDEVDLFEKMFICVYSEDGGARFYDVERPRPPKEGRPSIDETVSFDGFIEAIAKTYDERNNPGWEWK
jgi:hypothetical protein